MNISPSQWKVNNVYSLKNNVLFILIFYTQEKPVTVQLRSSVRLVWIRKLNSWWNVLNFIACRSVRNSDAFLCFCDHLIVAWCTSPYPQRIFCLLTKYSSLICGSHLLWKKKESSIRKRRLSKQNETGIYLPVWQEHIRAEYCNCKELEQSPCGTTKSTWSLSVRNILLYGIWVAYPIISLGIMKPKSSMMHDLNP